MPNKYGYAVDDTMMQHEETSVAGDKVSMQGFNNAVNKELDDKFTASCLNIAGDKLEAGSMGGTKKDMKKQKD